MAKREYKFKTTGDLIRRLRKKKGISQSQLAVALGYPRTSVSSQYVSNIERGQCGIPKQKVSALAKSLSVPRKVIVDSIIKQEKEKLS